MEKPPVTNEDILKAVQNVAGAQASLASDFQGLTTRVASLESSRSSFENRHTGTDQALEDLRSEARRSISDAEAEKDAELAAVAQRHDELAEGVTRELIAVKTTVRDQVAEAVQAVIGDVLDAHVDKLNAAAAKVTRWHEHPRVKSYAAIAGTALAAASIELGRELWPYLKQLSHWF